MTHLVSYTSEAQFFSFLLERERRDLRGIDRRDFQAAIKYGKKEPGWPHPVTKAPRWKYTWADIVYITDESSTREVTSYAEPIDIPRPNLKYDDVADHVAVKTRLAEDPSLCTSHTVIVVDQSASMKNSDVFDFKDRSKAVFGMLALHFVAQQRFRGEAIATDVVSLVLMRDEADVIFERVPMGLVLYDRFVKLYESSVPRSHGNFVPALDKAEDLLKGHYHSGCALSLLFLSDGKPSDQCARRWTSESELGDIIQDRMHRLASEFGEQLSVSTLGFAKPEQDFSVLEVMARAANGQFHRPELSSYGLETALSQAISSIATIKRKLTSSVEHGHQVGRLRDVEHNAAGNCYRHRLLHTPSVPNGGDCGWKVHHDVKRHKFITHHECQDSNRWMHMESFSQVPEYSSVRTKCLRERAEHVSFEIQVGGDPH